MEDPVSIGCLSLAKTFHALHSHTQYDGDHFQNDAILRAAQNRAIQKLSAQASFSMLRLRIGCIARQNKNNMYYVIRCDLFIHTLGWFQVSMQANTPVSSVVFGFVATKLRILQLRPFHLWPRCLLPQPAPPTEIEGTVYALCQRFRPGQCLAECDERLQEKRTPFWVCSCDDV